MKTPKTKVGAALGKLASAKCLALAGLVALAPATVNAQRLAQPNGWRWFSPSSDTFNDFDLGWQWTHNHGFYNFERSYEDNGDWSKQGNPVWTRFKTQNAVMTGNHLRIINWIHSSPESAYNPKTKKTDSYKHSGGIIASKAKYLTEGQFQCYSKVQWNHRRVWPTFWLDKGQRDELDVMQYQRDILDHSQVWKVGGTRLSQRAWPFWMTPKWEHDWAMARVRSWTWWATRTTRSTFPTFYINGKKEHTGNIRKVDSQMEMLFTSSPHFQMLPRSGNLPDYRITYVETYVP